MRLAVRLTPGAARDAIQDWSLDDKGRPVLAARVRARPVEGAANAALIALLADRLDLSRSAVRLARGSTGRIKTLEIDSLSEDEVARRLGRDL